MICRFASANDQLIWGFEAVGKPNYVQHRVCQKPFAIVFEMSPHHSTTEEGHTTT